MLKSLFSRKTQIDPSVLRKSKPTRNLAVSYEILEDGTAMLDAPLRAQQGLAGALARKMKAPETKKFELEAVGAYVWELCDGRHTFEGIAKKLRERFKMNRLEAEASLGAFLQTLLRKGLVSIAIKDR